MFGDLRDELIRDRIVLGIRDKNLSERLQLDSELTLSKAINAVRPKEVVKKQQNLMSFKAFSAQPTIDAVKSSKQRNPSRGKSADVDSRYNKSEKNQNKQSATKCERCSGPPHQKQACPVRNSKCHSCEKVRHWTQACRSKKPHKISGETFLYLLRMSISLVKLNLMQLTAIMLVKYGRPRFV